eukprot:5901097-Prymnesium_polylepis.1
MPPTPPAEEPDDDDAPLWAQPPLNPYQRPQAQAGARAPRAAQAAGARLHAGEWDDRLAGGGGVRPRGGGAFGGAACSGAACSGYDP